MDCFGAYLKHVQTCDDVRVQSATQSTASVHTWNMSKPVMTFVFKVLRNGLLRCMSTPVMTFVFKVLRNRLLGYTYLKHVQTCDDVRVQSAKRSTASVQKKKRKKKKKKKGA